MRSASGAVHDLQTGDWSAAASPEEEALLSEVRGPALDIGCGPGRLIHSLGARGVPTLGIDVAPSALDLARQRGPVLDRSVFDQLPGEGRWADVLLFDGNIGIGGDPRALLRRVARLLAPDGVALVEVGPHGVGIRREAVLLERDGNRTPWFPWAWVGADAVADLAEEAGLVASRVAEVDGRWFAWLRHPPRP